MLSGVLKLLTIVVFLAKLISGAAVREQQPNACEKVSFASEPRNSKFTCMYDTDLASGFLKMVVFFLKLVLLTCTIWIFVIDILGNLK